MYQYYFASMLNFFDEFSNNSFWSLLIGRGLPRLLISSRVWNHPRALALRAEPRRPLLISGAPCTAQASPTHSQSQLQPSAAAREAAGHSAHVCYRVLRCRSPGRVSPHACTCRARMRTRARSCRVRADAHSAHACARAAAHCAHACARALR